MDGSICCKSEKHLQILDLLRQYRKELEKLLVAFNAARYATCDRLMKALERLMQQIIVLNPQPFFSQRQSALQAEQLRIQELQLEFYERSNNQLNDLLKRMPKRTQLNRLEKFL